MARVAFSQIAPSALLRQTMGFQASPPSLATFRIDATRCVTPLMRLSPVDRPSAHHFCRVSALDSVRMRRHPGRFAPSISADHLYEMPTNRQLGCRERLSDQSALLLREYRAQLSPSGASLAPRALQLPKRSFRAKFRHIIDNSERGTG